MARFGGFCHHPTIVEVNGISSAWSIKNDMMPKLVKELSNKSSIIKRIQQELVLGLFINVVYDIYHNQLQKYADSHNVR